MFEGSFPYKAGLPELEKGNPSDSVFAGILPEVSPPDVFVIFVSGGASPNTLRKGLINALVGNITAKTEAKISIKMNIYFNALFKI